MARHVGSRRQHTELLLDDLQDLLLIELLRKTLDGSQGLTTIALCGQIHVSHGCMTRQRGATSDDDRGQGTTWRGRQ